jgi:hypothetical protein
VQPHLHRFERSYSLRPLHTTLSKYFVDETYTEDKIADITGQIDEISRFVSIFAQWGLCKDRAKRDARDACKHVTDELARSWSRALSARATRTRTGDIQSVSMALRLSNVEELNKLFRSVGNCTRSAVESLENSLRLLAPYVQRLGPDPTLNFSPVHETVINQLSEIARITGSSCMTEVDDRSSTFTGNMIATYKGSLFIVAPAGFGKTSF